MHTSERARARPLQRNTHTRRKFLCTFQIGFGYDPNGQTSTLYRIKSISTHQNLSIAREIRDLYMVFSSLPLALLSFGLYLWITEPIHVTELLHTSCIIKICLHVVLVVDYGRRTVESGTQAPIDRGNAMAFRFE